MSDIEQIVNFRLDTEARVIYVRFIILQDFYRYKESEYYEKAFKLMKSKLHTTYKLPQFQLIDADTEYICDVIDTKTLVLYILHNGYYCDSVIISCESSSNATIDDNKPH